MTIKIIPNTTGSPAGKLADAEMHFDTGPLAGLKLIGFAVWERRTGTHRHHAPTHRRAALGRNVTFPARTYAINGERRSFALLRPIMDTTGQDAIRDLILHAYASFEQEQEQQQTASTSANGSPL